MMGRMCVRIKLLSESKEKEGPTRGRVGPPVHLFTHTQHYNHQWNVTTETLTENQVFTDTNTNWLPTECSGRLDHDNLRCSVLDMVPACPHHKQSLYRRWKWLTWRLCRCTTLMDLLNATEDSSLYNSMPMVLLSVRDRLRLKQEERATARLQHQHQRDF